MVCYFQRNNLAETKKFSRVERQSNLCNARRRKKKSNLEFCTHHFFFALRDSPETDLRSTMCGHRHQPFTHYVSTTRKFNFNKCEKRNKNAFCSPMLSIRRIFAYSFFLSRARARYLAREQEKNMVEIPTTCELAISFRLYNAIDFITLYLDCIGMCFVRIRIYATRWWHFKAAIRYLSSTGKAANYKPFIGCFNYPTYNVSGIKREILFLNNFFLLSFVCFGNKSIDVVLWSSDHVSHMEWISAITLR